MIAELLEDGKLAIYPESALESYALRHWFALFCASSGKKDLVVTFDIYKREEV